jgi:fructose-specific phosphotransferase system IIC component
MRVLRSVIYGYLGAILGGLLVAIVGVTLDFPHESIAAASVPTGVIFGMLGLSLIWWRPIAQRVGSEAGQEDRGDRRR